MISAVAYCSIPAGYDTGDGVKRTCPEALFTTLTNYRMFLIYSIEIRLTVSSHRTVRNADR